MENPCKNNLKCDNCSNHFMQLRPEIKDFKIAVHFERDIKDKEEREQIIQKILSCNALEHEQLHKFEMNVKGNKIFRAKINSVHIVYYINKNKEIVFLRAIKNFKEYGKFLSKDIERFL